MNVMNVKCNVCGKLLNLREDTAEEISEYHYVNGKIVTEKKDHLIFCPKCYVVFRKKLYKVLKD